MIGNGPFGQTEGRRSRNRFFTVMAVILALTAVAVAVLLTLFFLGDGFLADLLPGTEPTPTLLAQATLPGPTPRAGATGETSATAEATARRNEVAALPATSTPLPALQSSADAPFATLQPTQTPSPIPTFPTRTPTPTYTPTPTFTPTPGPSPTATNTPSAFLFTKSVDSPFPLERAGCRWMGVGGEVLDVDGSPVAGDQYRVHIWESGVDAMVPVGGATQYGPSGFELFLHDEPRVQQHNIQLETVSGTAVSQVYRIETFANCRSNLVYFVFERNR
ncbi:MAG: hypothetical protein R3300_14085 [Candidatus Promineifilaceae bacterium]|nr:hypothetical protein [Candidatus Promineifilaceae bacterium]